MQTWPNQRVSKGDQGKDISQRKKGARNAEIVNQKGNQNDRATESANRSNTMSLPSKREPQNQKQVITSEIKIKREP